MGWENAPGYLQYGEDAEASSAVERLSGTGPIEGVANDWNAANTTVQNTLFPDVEKLNPAQMAQVDAEVASSVMADSTASAGMLSRAEESARAIQLNAEADSGFLGKLLPESATTGSGGYGGFVAGAERNVFAPIGRTTEGLLDKVLPGEGVFAEGGIMPGFLETANPATLGLGVVGAGLGIASYLLYRKHKNNVNKGLS